MMKNLKSPLRVHWDLAPERAGGLETDRAVALAAELASLKVFFVTVRLLDGPRPDVGQVLNALKRGGVRVTVSSGSPGSLPAMEDIAHADQLDLCPEDAGTLRELLNDAAGFAPGIEALSVSVVPSRKDLGRMREIISLALAAGVRTFNLPNPNLVYGGVHAEDYALDGPDREKIKRMLEELLRPLGQYVRLNVHDLFLHKALDLPGLGGRIEYAGCQAGEQVAFIDRSGVLYPCASWPVPLGDLDQAAFSEIWSGAERKLLRERLSSPPAGCGDCPDLSTCKGGCRGLASVMCGPDSKDPNCER